MNLTRLARYAALSLALTCGCGIGHAVMAYPGAIEHINPDGTTMSIFRNGDENFNYTTTSDGCLITLASDGFYHYARVVDGTAVATEFIAADPQARKADAAMMLAGLDQHAMVEQLRDANPYSLTDPAINGPMKSATNGQAEKTTSFPTSGSPRVLVILVEYPDYKFNYDKQMFQDWLTKEGYNYNNGTGTATGSVLDYYKASSNGQFTPQFDLYGPVVASHERAYYGETQNSNKRNVTQLVREACETLKATTDINFANYDNTGDGYVDNVYVIYAGPGYADSNDEDAIWPHKWYLSGGSNAVRIDNKIINQYGCSAELSSGRYFTAIGTFSHEFGHVLGLGDHYDTGYCGNRDPGKWDIMASGSYNNNGNTPPLFSAYERFVMGWINPVQLSEQGNYTLNATTAGGYNDAYLIPTTKANEYFVLENRQKSGWDTYLPHHGMLIWHIDYNSSVWSSNKINCYAHQYIDIEEAGDPANRDETATPFPGSTGSRSFTDSTTPSMRMWSGAKLESPITKITETPDGIISFKFKGGIPTPSNLELLEPVTTHNQATIAWKPIDGVEEYLVSVSEPVSGTILAEEVAVTGTSFTLTMLDPKTTYEYSVAYYENYSWPESTGTFTTTTTPLNTRRPENIVTTEVGDSHFSTQWDEMELAERYSISVYTGEIGGATTITEFFDDSSTLNGWSTSSTTFVTTASYYGSAAPSLRLDAADYVVSQIFDGNVTKIVFMHRRIGNTAATAQVFGRQSQNDNWTELTSKQIAAGKARTTVEVEPGQKIHQIMIIQPDEGASIMVDDIAVSVDASIELTPLENMTGIDAGAATSYTVRGLDHETTYFYTVQAHNATHDSLESAPIEVTTEASSGIDNVITDTNTSVTVEGMVATVTTGTDATVGIYTPSGLGVIAPVRLLAGASAAFQLPAKGVYLVKVGSTTHKVIAD